MKGEIEKIVVIRCVRTAQGGADGPAELVRSGAVWSDIDYHMDDRGATQLAKQL